LNWSKNTVSKNFIKELDQLYTTVGVHPTRCNEFEENPKEHLKKLLEQCEIGMNLKKVVAIGEFVNIFKLKKQRVWIMIA
jgi:Tat protein secretion system quality control protein TatD with DNase activity